MSDRHDAQSNGVANYDLFISHASEDNAGFVRPLAKILRSLGVIVWYDEFSLAVGDSLSSSIDRGLANSRFGLVVLSPHFVQKKWPVAELQGLVARARGKNADKLILPVWHGISQSEVLAFSPTLADTVVIRTEGTDAVSIAMQIVKIVRSDIYERESRAALQAHVGQEDIDSLQNELEGQLRERIRKTIRTNGREEITGQTMQEVLIAIVDYVSSVTRKPPME